MDVTDFRALAVEVSNWGRWGAEDRRGALNLITPERIVAAAALVRRGAVFNLGIPFDKDGPQGVGTRINPQLLVTQTGRDQDYDPIFKYVDDALFTPLQAASQWDALGHVFYDEQFYNGHPAEIATSQGLRALSIADAAGGIVGRGVLLDIARLRGVEWMEAGDAISADDLDEACEKQGVQVSAGDVLIVRTGWRRKFLVERSPAEWRAGEPGLGMASVRWIRNRDVAAVCSDNRAIEVQPGEVDGMKYNVHLLLLRDMGVMLAEILDLESLAADCAADGVYEFLFTAPPLEITGAAGSPVNPLALK